MLTFDHDCIHKILNECKQLQLWRQTLQPRDNFLELFLWGNMRRHPVKTWTFLISLNDSTVHVSTGAWQLAAIVPSLLFLFTYCISGRWFVVLGIDYFDIITSGLGSCSIPWYKALICFTAFFSCISYLKPHSSSYYIRFGEWCDICTSTSLWVKLKENPMLSTEAYAK